MASSFASSPDQAPLDPTLTPVDDPEQEHVVHLAGEWAYLPDVAQRYGIPVTRVRRYLADRELLALRVGPSRALAVPERFLGPGGPWPQLKGTFTVLADGGMADLDILRWLFTPDPTLPVPGTPLEALLAGHKKEVRRRAQALAF